MSVRHSILCSLLAFAACGGAPSTALDATERTTLGRSIATAEAVYPGAVPAGGAGAPLPDTDDALPPAAPSEADLAASTEEDVLVAPFQLRRGETLAHFARWAEIPVEEVAERSGLSLTGPHDVGTRVSLTLTLEERAEVERRREAHRVRRVEGYVGSRGGSEGIGFHTVRSGETAWSIARDHQRIPVWLLEAYNPSVDLDGLRPGQELRVPLLGSTVVDGAER
jgi:nucleoid-associated protein YgaU